MVKKVLGSLVVLSMVIWGGTVLQAMGGKTAEGKSEVKETKVKMSEAEIRQYEKMSQEEVEKWWKVRREEIWEQLVKRYKGDEKQAKVEMELIEHYRKKLKPQVPSLIKSVRKAMKDKTLCPPDYEDMRLLDLGRAEDPRGIPVLIEVLKTYEVAEARVQAASALGGIKDKSVINALKEALNDENKKVRGSASCALALSGEIELVLPLLIKAKAFIFLKDLGIKEAIPAMKAALQDKDIKVRLEAALSLINLDPDNSKVLIFPVLRDALKDNDKWIRNEALCCLAEIGDRDKEAFHLLKEGVNDKDEYIRRTTLRLLERLGRKGNKEAICLIKEGLNDKDEYVRDDALKCLKRLAKEGNKDAISSLKEALKHENRNVREESKQILEKIEEKPK
ncbi:MAG: HEAT repeat domain-containing protein [bacterium]